MTEDMTWETEQFQRHRAHLQAVAYRMLGSASDTEDAVQEAWLRLSRSQQDTIHNVRAWLTTIVGRVCIDMLRSRQSRREEYVSSVPEPIVVIDEQADQANPVQQILLADSVGLALQVVLETLTPAERVAYVLHDMFSLPFAEIGEIIERSPEAARQLASRGRRRVRGAALPPERAVAEHRDVVSAFLAASRAGEFDKLVAALAPDAVFRASGTPAVEQEVTGAADVAGKWARFGPNLAALCHAATVNGQPGLVIDTRYGPVGAVSFQIVGGVINIIELVFDPERLETPGWAPETRPADVAEGVGFDAESALLDFLRGVEGAVTSRISREVLSWPGVRRGTGHLGSVMFELDGRELGHLHGDAVADIPLADIPCAEPGAQLGASEPAGHQSETWVSVSLDDETAVQRVLAAMRENYQRLASPPLGGRAGN